VCVCARARVCGCAHVYVFRHTCVCLLPVRLWALGCDGYLSLHMYMVASHKHWWAVHGFSSYSSWHGTGEPLRCSGTHVRQTNWQHNTIQHRSKHCEKRSIRAHAMQYWKAPHVRPSHCTQCPPSRGQATPMIERVCRCVVGESDACARKCKGRAGVCGLETCAYVWHNFAATTAAA